MLRLHVDVDPPGGLREGLHFDLPAGAARHAQVRRVQPGDALLLFDGRGGEWLATVHAMGRQQVSVELQRHDPVERELPLAVTLAVGMPANERMDTLVEKATELGAAALQPLMCERAVLRLDGERAERKREHWQAQAVAAAEQCGRTRVPQLLPVRRFDDWLRQPRQGTGWVLSPVAGRPLPPEPPSVTALTLLTGPEGGLAPAEVERAVAAGFEPLHLGPRVLRADTAPLAVLAWLGLSALTR